ncbi:indeterminate(ID)-domain 14 [Rhynchospora pubera]|uniref:Indeterminate(ID)-domain 14 n=1 Tax=Rhynchospora pubera TaxID=906938 RepID=A0AAV8HN26_9POAL|nr:indeterminate(ID)-domain 14 [Rhynchospora pubera]
MLSSPPPASTPAPMPPPPPSLPSLQINTKKKRRPAGTPDPDAEVVSLSPRTLLESDRYVCEICNQGFQRDQNLQMHRRRHKVPWKLLKRETAEASKKRVFVCPEQTCLHHDPCHALGDLVGIKKHFRRKHSGHRQWVCAKCSKAYAVQSDYKAHLKTCGTRGHSCDCGRVFSRVESFIEHQDTCNASRSHAELNSIQSPVSPLASPSTPINTIQNRRPTLPSLRIPNPSSMLLQPSQATFLLPNQHRTASHELQLLPPFTPRTPINFPSPSTSPISTEESDVTKLQLSIGPSSASSTCTDRPMLSPESVKLEAKEQYGLALMDKTRADEVRQQAKRQVELAEDEFAKAKRIRQQAQMELSRAQALRDHAVKQISSALLEITCFSCKQQFQAKPLTVSEDNSFVMSAVTDGEVANYDQVDQGKN